MATPIFRCVSKKPLASHSVFTSAARAYGVQLVAKNSPPPKASNPPPREVERAPSPRKFNRGSFAKRNSNRKAEPPLSPKVSRRSEAKNPTSSSLPRSSWVSIHNIPIMSTLDDIVKSINQVLDSFTGIVDLDVPWKSGGQVTLLEPPKEWIRSARIKLSSHGRPSAWKIEFHNRSIAHAFLEYSRTHEFLCAWKPVDVVALHEPRQKDDDNDVEVSDSMIRVENCSDHVTIDHVRHLFRRYDMSMKEPSVRVLNEGSQHKMFLVHFADPSWARAAVRELQGVRVRQDHLRLAQYPKQILCEQNTLETY